MKKRISSLLIGCLVSAVFAGSVMAGDDIKVGFVVKSLADQHWAIVKAGAQAEAAKEGVELIFIAPNQESDVQTQVQMIEDLIAQDVDALCVAPSSQDAVLPAFRAATESGIPILAIDTDTKYDKKASFIGTGNFEAAKKGAAYAASLYKSGDKAIIIRGRLGDPTHDARSNGIKAALDDANIDILEIKDAKSMASLAMDAMMDLLVKYNDIDLVVCTADEMALGAQRAIQQSGADAKVMGFDGTIPVAEMTAKGKFIGTTAQSPYQMGTLGVKEGVKAAKGEKIEKRIDSGAEVVTPETADAYIKNLNKLLGK